MITLRDTIEIRTSPEKIFDFFIHFKENGSFGFGVALQADVPREILESPNVEIKAKIGDFSRLKQLVNKKTREDHRSIMDGMLQLYAQYRETEEKRTMGFRMSEWDKKLLKYGKLFEDNMMDLKVNIPLEKALDNGWRIMADCFSPEESNFRTELIEKFWPR